MTWSTTARIPILCDPDYWKLDSQNISLGSLVKGLIVFVYRHYKLCLIKLELRQIGRVLLVLLRPDIRSHHAWAWCLPRYMTCTIAEDYLSRVQGLLTETLPNIYKDQLQWSHQKRTTNLNIEIFFRVPWIKLGSLSAPPEDVGLPLKHSRDQK